MTYVRFHRRAMHYKRAQVVATRGVTCVLVASASMLSLIEYSFFRVF
jgi:hypothetical protein